MHDASSGWNDLLSTVPMTSLLGNRRSGQGSGVADGEDVRVAVAVALAVWLAVGVAVPVADSELVTVLLGDHVCADASATSHASATAHFPAMLRAISDSAKQQNTREGMRDTE